MVVIAYGLSLLLLIAVAAIASKVRVSLFRTSTEQAGNIGLAYLIIGAIAGIVTLLATMPFYDQVTWLCILSGPSTVAVVAPYIYELVYNLFKK